MRRDAGLTLIELVLAMAIFALVAVLGLQSLSAMLRMRDRLEQSADRSDRLGTGLSLLRADLAGLVPILFHPPGGATPRSALVFRGAAGAAQLELSTGHVPQPGGPGVPGLPLGRVTWRLDPGSGALLRREWPLLTPADPAAQGPEAEILSGIAALRLRSYWDQFGWVEGTMPAQLAAAPLGAATDADSGPLVQQYSSQLPEAVELTLVTRAQGELRLVETLR